MLRFLILSFNSAQFFKTQSPTTFCSRPQGEEDNLSLLESSYCINDGFVVPSLFSKQLFNLTKSGAHPNAIALHPHNAWVSLPQQLGSEDDLPGALLEDSVREVDFSDEMSSE